MLFHIIDSKQKCKSVYTENRIDKDPNYKLLSKTWSYNPTLKDYDIEFASLYTGGKTIDESCPEHLKSEWENVKRKHFAFLNSFKQAKVRAGDYCFYDLVPESFLLEYNTVKSKITKYILSSHKKPNNYNFLVELSGLADDISTNKLNIDKSAITPYLHQYKARKFKDKLSKIDPHIRYNVFGTVTGRLTTKKESFPILTMDRAYRGILKPSNDFFVELDFNAAELRCLLALNDQPQPETDLHLWHQKKINYLYSENLNRDEIKTKMFAWLYGGPNASLGMPEIENCYNKQGVVKKYWDGEYVLNPFGRQIKCDQFRALNFIIQSTTSDIFLRKAIEINNMLKGRKSLTMCLIHDSMIIDFSGEDRAILKNIIQEFGNTEFGKFKVNVKIGNRFGNMKDVSL